MFAYYTVSVFPWNKLTRKHELTMFIYQTSLRDQYYEKAVDLYYREGLSVRRIAKIIPASKTTVMRWIANFAEDNPHKAPIMKKRSIKPAPQIEQELRTDLPEDVKALQAEVLRLKKELKQEKMRADAYDMMIDLAEDAFKIPIRKKSGAEQ